MAGVAWQLQQPVLWAAPVYGVLCAFAGLGLAMRVRVGPCGAPDARQRVATSVVVAALLATSGFAFTGWRAAVFQAGALSPSLENADVRVTGHVAELPQLSPTGWRFVFEVDGLIHEGQRVDAPRRVLLSWWGGPQRAQGQDGAPAWELNAWPPVLSVGERWELPVRLRRPHGLANPHGFDRELWLWQLGVQATGSVRTGRGEGAQRLPGPVPWSYALARARQWVADAIRAQVREPRSAGVLVALVVGDQSAIDLVTDNTVLT